MPAFWPGVCLRLRLKLESSEGGVAAGCARRCEPPHSAPPYLTPKPKLLCGKVSTGVGVFGMCWRCGAGGGVAGVRYRRGARGWEWTQVSEGDIMGFEGFCRRPFRKRCPLHQMRRPQWLILLCDRQHFCVGSTCQSPV